MKTIKVSKADAAALKRIAGKAGKATGKTTKRKSRKRKTTKRKTKKSCKK